VIHPFMPFITEEIWQMLSERKDGESIMVNRMPHAGKVKRPLIEKFETAKEIVSAVRTIRKEKDLPLREKTDLFVKCTAEDFDRHFLPVIIKMANLSSVFFTDKQKAGSASFLVGTMEFFIPLENKIDLKAEILRIEEELNYARGFLSSVMKKLDNERFVQNAPPSVIEIEKKKKSDAESKIGSLEARLIEMKSL
jgi:valyl-tRNA synthetase